MMRLVSQYFNLLIYVLVFCYSANTSNTLLLSNFENESLYSRNIIKVIKVERPY